MSLKGFVITEDGKEFGFDCYQYKYTTESTFKGEDRKYECRFDVPQKTFAGPTKIVAVKVVDDEGMLMFRRMPGGYVILDANMSMTVNSECCIFIHNH